MAVRDLSKLPPDMLRRIRKDHWNATYVTDGRCEFTIEQRGNFYYIKPFSGGKYPKICYEMFTSFVECEKTLVRHLKATNRWGRAIYPDRFDAD